MKKSYKVFIEPETGAHVGVINFADVPGFDEVMLDVSNDLSLAICFSWEVKEDVVATLNYGMLMGTFPCGRVYVEETTIQ